MTTPVRRCSWELTRGAWAGRKCLSPAVLAVEEFDGLLVPACSNHLGRVIELQMSGRTENRLVVVALEAK